ncbi:MAG: sugar ABC transporter permease, partial [Bacteroidetes bacterium]
MKRSLLGRVATHAALVVAVVFALYPVLWVISLAFSPGDAPKPSAVPWPDEWSMEHVTAVVRRTDDQGRWLFLR